MSAVRWRATDSRAILLSRTIAESIALKRLSPQTSRICMQAFVTVKCVHEWGSRSRWRALGELPNQAGLLYDTSRVVSTSQRRLETKQVAMSGPIGVCAHMLRRCSRGSLRSILLQPGRARKWENCNSVKAPRVAQENRHRERCRGRGKGSFYINYSEGACSGRCRASRHATGRWPRSGTATFAPLHRLLTREAPKRIDMSLEGHRRQKSQGSDANRADLCERLPARCTADSIKEKVEIAASPLAGHEW